MLKLIISFLFRSELRLNVLPFGKGNIFILSSIFCDSWAKGHNAARQASDAVFVCIFWFLRTFHSSRLQIPFPHSARFSVLRYLSILKVLRSKKYRIYGSK